MVVLVGVHTAQGLALLWLGG